MVKIIQPKTSKKVTAKELETQEVLSKLRHQSEEEQAATLAASLNLPYMDTNIVPISDEMIRMISEEDSRKNNSATIQKTGKTVTIISSDPSQQTTQEFVKKLEKENGWHIKLFVVSATNMHRIWERYKRIVFVDFIDQLSVNLKGDDLISFEEEMKDLITLKQRISELPTTQVINVIMAGAYKLGASDIHIEPQENQVRLRYRIDGVLQDIVFLPLPVCKSIVTRIKMMGGMKINLRDIAQDGTFAIHLDSEKGPKKIETRVSIIPGNFGESVVIRLLDPDSISVTLEKLGLRGLAYEEIQKQIQAPNGMILNTGPTGSGKTTTLYAIINKLNEPDKKIITIEDPIEYEVVGISQTQVEKSRGYTFASGLRAIVRQDPDVILVGEIRDDETADIAVNSALTGHLVLSSLHTNNAVGAIPRLIELGVKPSLISPSVNAAIGQRLVRKLCDCKEAYVPAHETIDSLKKMLSIISPKSKVEIPKNVEKLYRPKGCMKCNNLGYKGRIGIFEVFTINPEIEKLVMDLAGETELTVAALESGMIAMLQDGLLKAIEGITSIDEVKRVTGQGEFLEDLYERLMSQTLGKSFLISQEVFEKTKPEAKDIKTLEKLITESKNVDLNKIIFSSAFLLKVNDIHIEPGAEKVKIRFRIDGILQDIAEIPINEYPRLLGEIKLLSGVKTEVREGVIDSRFSIRFDDSIEGLAENDRSIDVRVSIILGGYGETVVMRLLLKSSLKYDLKKLGIRKENLDKILKEISKPNGIILNTGPTGSGKTTTLYSILQTLNTPSVKIITVEDPIEYQMEGILQTPVNEKDGYTFATALRSLMRQNPDIMMIGEIRDNETAQIATQAALTGHLVLSTLHANNAVGAVSRLTNMGVSSQDIATASNAFIAQRLVRKLCDCKEQTNPSEEEFKKIQDTLKTISPKSGLKIPEFIYIYKPKGCEKCNGLGYRGRMTVSEIFEISRDIQDMINRGAMVTELSDKAIENGMITMEQDGVLRVVEGETTLEEVERVTDL
jgi:type IV pilus assembly protein PilB